MQLQQMEVKENAILLKQETGMYISMSSMHLLIYIRLPFTIPYILIYVYYTLSHTRVYTPLSYTLLSIYNMLYYIMCTYTYVIHCTKQCTLLYRILTHYTAVLIYIYITYTYTLTHIHKYF